MRSKICDQVIRGMELLSWEIPPEQWQQCLRDPKFCSQGNLAFAGRSAIAALLGTGVALGAESWALFGFVWYLFTIFVVPTVIFQLMDRNRRPRITKTDDTSAAIKLTTLGFVVNDAAILWRAKKAQLIGAALNYSRVRGVSYLTLHFDNASIWRPSSFISLPVPEGLTRDIDSLIETIVGFGSPAPSTPRLP